MGRATMPGNSVSYIDVVSILLRSEPRSTYHCNVWVGVDELSQGCHLFLEIVLPDVPYSGIIFVLERTAHAVIILVGLYRPTSLKSHLCHLAWKQASIQHASIKAIVQIASKCEGTRAGGTSRAKGGSAEMSGRRKCAMLMRGSMRLKVALLNMIRSIHGLVSIARRRHNEGE